MASRDTAFVYILTNNHNTVLYTGSTSDLATRLQQHTGNPGHGFTGRYNAKKLVYIELCDSVEQAILRERQIKGGSRKDKIRLIEAKNPHWRDLSSDFV